MIVNLNCMESGAALQKLRQNYALAKRCDNQPGDRDPLVDRVDMGEGKDRIQILTEASDHTQAYTCRIQKDGHTGLFHAEFPEPGSDGQFSAFMIWDGNKGRTYEPAPRADGRGSSVLQCKMNLSESASNYLLYNGRFSLEASPPTPAT